MIGQQISSMHFPSKSLSFRHSVIAERGNCSDVLAVKRLGPIPGLWSAN